MRTKWLWTTWAYLAVVGVIVVELLFVGFVINYQLPKLLKLKSDGVFHFDAANASALSWLFSFLDGVAWAWNDAIWWVLGLAAGWGLFEWRVRSENKPFMRLSALGTAASEDGRSRSAHAEPASRL